VTVRALVRALLPGLALAGALMAAVACGDDPVEPVVLRVPGDHPTIQRAVDRAAPGDLVLVAAGTYAEEVSVATNGVTIRGTDRNSVVLDGGHELGVGITVTGDDVAIENLTVRNFTEDGVAFDGREGGRVPDDEGAFGTEGSSIDGFRVAYVTAANNGRTGIRTMAARHGRIERSAASGHRESGIHLGQCRPCDIVVSTSSAERNAIGVEATNTSRDLFVVGNRVTGNRVGIVVSTRSIEQLQPQAGATIVGNFVADNDSPQAPAEPYGLFATGIVVAGGTENVIARNRVAGHDRFGIGLVRLEGGDPVANRVEGNVATDNAVDVYFELPPGGVGTFGNCFGDNSYTDSLPAAVEQVLPCDEPAGPVVPGTLAPADAPPDVDHRSIPLPAAQPVMPGDLTDPSLARPEWDPDVDAVTVPPA
jgi:nitrous oxidase accessory protein NosD